MLRFELVKYCAYTYVLLHTTLFITKSPIQMLLNFDINCVVKKAVMPQHELIICRKEKT